MSKIKGITYAAVSSSTFGLAPCFTLLLLGNGYTPFEVLSYRWGIASLCMILWGLLFRHDFRLKQEEWGTVLGLSVFRAVTSLSLVFAYQNIASGVASTIHFMYPLAVALVITLFFRERKSGAIFIAVVMSVVGAILLSLGNIDFRQGNVTLGITAACISVFSYGGYIIGVRKSRAVKIDSTVLTCYVMAFGALFFILYGGLTEGIRLETNGRMWLYILGLALPATAISNMTLVKAIKYIGPTLTSVLGAMEPLTAVLIGIILFHELFTFQGGLGIVFIIAAVTLVVLYDKKQ